MVTFVKTSFSQIIILFPKIALLALPSKFPVLISIPFAGPIYASCPTPNERWKTDKLSRDIEFALISRFCLFFSFIYPTTIPLSTGGFLHRAIARLALGALVISRSRIPRSQQCPTLVHEDSHQPPHCFEGAVTPHMIERVANRVSTRVHQQSKEQPWADGKQKRFSFW